MAGKNFDNKNNILEDIYSNNNEPEQKFSYSNFQAQKQRNFELFSGNILAVIVVIFGFGTLIFGFYQLKNRVTYPYRPGQESITSFLGSDLSNDLNSQVNDLITLDTDKDGLSDYDEQNVYQTSPYLDDSDSDGTKDADEIKNSTDPNCAKGQNCQSQLTAKSQGTGLVSPSSQTASLGDITAQKLREALLQNGFPGETLNQLSDAELLEAYGTISAGDSGASANSGTQTSINSLEDIKKLPPESLRALLKEQGMTQEMLDKVTDDELISLVEETLKENK